MKIEVKVPPLSESITEATLLDWHKQVGEAVQRDEVLAELETDKVVLEVVAPGAGVLSEIRHASGDTVGSGEILALIDDEAAVSAASPAATREKPAPVAATPPQAAGRGEAGAQASVILSPAARKLAAENDLDPSRIRGTGRDHRITKADIVEHLRARGGKTDRPPPAPTAELAVAGERPQKRVPMSRLRARVAERLKAAQNTAAILTTFNEVDLQAVQALRARHGEAFEQTHGTRLGFMSFFTRAVVEALKRYPVINAALDGQDIVYHGYYDIGIAVGSPRGLVVPVLRDADRLSFAEIEMAIRDFGERAREGRLALEELSGGTFSISNGGVFGSLLSTPILNPPQSAILGMHKIEDRAVVVNGEIVIRPMMYLALSYDHRIIDGQDAVQFLVAVKRALEDPARLLLDL